MNLFILSLMWIVDLFGAATHINVSYCIDVLNQLFYIFEEHSILNAALFTGVLLIIAAVLFSKLEQEIKREVK